MDFYVVLDNLFRHNYDEEKLCFKLSVHIKAEIALTLGSTKCWSALLVCNHLWLNKLFPNVL